MRNNFVMVTLLMLLITMSVYIASAQSIICNPPYVTTPESDMLPLGTEVSFGHWEGGTLPVTRTGRVVCYYIRSKFPDLGGIVGLDDQAYVIDYGEKSTITLNRDELTVRQAAMKKFAFSGRNE